MRNRPSAAPETSGYDIFRFEQTDRSGVAGLQVGDPLFDPLPAIDRFPGSDDGVDRDGGVGVCPLGRLVAQMFAQLAHAGGVAIDVVAVVEPLLDDDSVVVGEGELRRRYLVCRNPAQAERERQSRIILSTAETEIAEKFARASEHYKRNPAALHLRAMNMVFEGLKKKGSMIIVPSTAVETMGLGAMGGLTAFDRILEDDAPATEKVPIPGELKKENEEV